MTLKVAAGLAFLIILAFLGNFYTVPLFFGADFLFGSLFVLLVLYYYGLGWGIGAALAAHSYTYFLWGHPYALINFTCEAVVVGLLLKHGRRNLLMLDGVYWLLLGMPLAWFFHGILLHMDSVTASFIMLKQGINGIFNALLASLTICCLPLGKLLPPSPRARTVTLRESLFNLLVMMVLVPALLLTMLDIRGQKARLEAKVIAELQSLSGNVQFHLHSWYQQHLQAVQEMALLVSSSSMTPSAQVQRETEILKQAFPDFLTLLVVNASGQTIAFAPNVNKQGRSTIGIDFSDRPWFQESKAKLKPVVSEVFLGDKVAFAPLVVLSVPVLKENFWLGCAAAGLDLSQVQELLQPYRSDKIVGLTLTDAQGRVIASTAPDRAPMLVWDPKQKGESRAVTAGIYLRRPAEKGLPSMTRWKQSFYFQETSIAPELPWKLTAEAPVAPLQQLLYSIYVKNLSVMAILAALALLLAQVFSRWITRPLTQLAQVTANLQEKLPESADLPWPASSAQEIQSLIYNFTSMANDLKNYFQQLQVQSAELWQANAELLQEVNVRQQAEEAMLSERNKLKAILATFPEGVYIVNSTHDIEYINPVIEREFGQMAGRKCYQYFHGHAEPCPWCKSPHVFAGQSVRWEWHSPRTGKTYELFATPLKNVDGSVSKVEIFHDITQRMRTEADRLRLAKLESLGVLAGGLAHDFNNILTAVLGNIGLAALESGSPENIKNRLSDAEKACQRATVLANRLLAFAKGGLPLIKPVAVPDLLQEAASLALSGSKTRYIFSLAENLQAVAADAGQLHQVLNNIFINADQAMPHGGLLTVTAANLEIAADSHLPLKPGQFVELIITDQGIGIPSESLDKIFDPYFTTKQKGSGLGLATAYAIIQNHQGHISVTSILGEGTTFSLYLPAASGFVVPEQPEVSEPYQGKGRILVMDDEDLVREVLGRMLQKLGFEAVLTRDGAEAVQRYTQDHKRGESFDAVILDLTVPGGLGGQEALEKLRQFDPQVKAVVSSGYADAPIMADFGHYGFCGAVVKPYKISRLSRVLQEVIPQD